MKNIKNKRTKQPLLFNQLRNKLSDKNFILLITALYFIVCFIGITYHQMWRDEYQAWQLSRFSQDISVFWKYFKYEAHMIIWYLILFGISRIWDNPLGMQYIHLFFAVVGIFLFLRYSPFTRLIKILVASGYFLIFEYSIISRPYVLIVVSLFLICIMINQYLKKPIIFAIILVFLANIHFLSYMISVILLLTIIWDLYESRDLIKEQKIHIFNVVTSLFILLAGFLFASYVLYRFSLTDYRWQGGFDIRHLGETCGRMLSAYFPISKSIGVDFWNNILFSEFPPFILIIIFISIVSFFFIYFSNKRKVAVFYLITSLGIFYPSYYSLYKGIRHEGPLFLILIASYWIYLILPNDKNIQSLQKLQVKLKAIFYPVMYTVLAIQVFAGVNAYINNLNYPFSNIKKAGEYINTHNLSNQLLYGSIDYAVSPLTVITGKPVYFPERDSLQYFLICDSKRIQYPPLPEIFEKASRLLSNQRDSLLLITTFGLEFSKGNEALYSDYNFMTVKVSPTDSVQIAFRGKCDDDCISGDEKYYFFELKRIHI
jgi:hypothetical protein